MAALALWLLGWHFHIPFVQLSPLPHLPAPRFAGGPPTPSYSQQLPGPLPACCACCRVADGTISMEEARQRHHQLLKRQHFGREPPPYNPSSF